jgi:anti-sigma regulatory factor (Ser/Thr protein kinase)
MTSHLTESPEQSRAEGLPARRPTSHPIPTPRSWIGQGRELLEVLPAVPAALGQVRAEFSEWLTQQRWPASDAYDIVLAVNEAVSNVIDHAYPASAPGPVALHARVTAGSGPATRRVTITVTDHGEGCRENRGPGPIEQHGRGYALIRACTTSAHIRRSVTGTTVTLLSKEAPQARRQAFAPVGERVPRMPDTSRGVASSAHVS